MLENPSIHVHWGNPLHDQQCLVLLPESFLYTYSCPHSSRECVCARMCVLWGRKLYSVQIAQQWYHMAVKIWGPYPNPHCIKSGVLFSPVSGGNVEKQRTSPLIQPTAHFPFLRADPECYEQSLGLPSPGTRWHFQSFLLYSAGTEPGAYSSSARA